MNKSSAEILSDHINWIEQSAYDVKHQFDQFGYDYDLLKDYADLSVSTLGISESESVVFGTEILDSFSDQDSDFYEDKRELIFQSLVGLPSLNRQLENGFIDLGINFHTPQDTDTAMAHLNFGDDFEKIYQKYRFPSS
ncbi:hypothetical protein [Vibrio splendidus]|uniref:hypothetical protein n=1 Tax=Vibrio splendidus TaxID=29497 RepID=UPI000C854E93|nr:hypothetical protein [Vibrio splendidus]PMO67174.1 hypothetical protein BCT03_24450 [Vibrio splendidus]